MKIEAMIANCPEAARNRLRDTLGLMQCEQAGASGPDELDGGFDFFV